jgi:hypothetical protein
MLLAGMAMEKVHNSSSEDRISNVDEITDDLLQKALREIFQSSPFRASKQSQDLLRYIVDQTMAGHIELLKERLIGVNVFGRRPDYDTNEDPIVRARAAEVRKRLAQFYLGEGRRAAIRIEISPGSYHASFIETQKTVVPEPANPRPPVLIELPSLVPALEPIPSPHPTKASRKLLSKRAILISMSASLLLIGIAVGSWFLLIPQAPLDAFWKPITSASNPAVLYSGANSVYMLSNAFLDRYKAAHRLSSLEGQGLEFIVPIAPNIQLNGDDLVSYTNDFITLGDLSAAVRVSSLLAIQRKQFDMRCGDDVSFSDLRQAPTVLIGGFNNRWTMELSRDLPFTLYHMKGMTIKEQEGAQRVWSPVPSADGKIAVDYALVTRLPRSKTGQPLIIIAGLTQNGTQAAADFITDSKQIKKLVSGAPSDWSQKNLEFVLQTKVVNNIPTSPVIVALKFW